MATCDPSPCHLKDLKESGEALGPVLPSPVCMGGWKQEPPQSVCS